MPALTRNLAWQVAGIGDLNGDGRDDVLLRHTDSRWYYYPMDGRNYLADERGYANLTRNPDWSIADTDTLASAGAPDLVVESPSVSDSTLTEGESFTFSATIRNQGAGESAATTLRYYRSSDSTISSSDTPAGTDAVGGLAASGSDDKSTTLTAPSSAGTYYYGACVESVSGESDTGNNCSSGVSVTVSDSQVDGSATRYAVGDVVTTLPTGTWFPDVTSGSASFGFSDGNSVLNLGNGGYIEEGGFRYTCESTGGCEVRNREVRAGTIVQTSTTTMPGDTQPRFAVANGPGNQSYRVGTAISALTLPEASGGDGTLSYSLSPSVPGLSFDAMTRQLTGTPTAAGTHALTYTVTDEDGDTDSLRFTITVEDGGVSGGPDLVVQSPSISDAGPDPGASITFSVTVRNQGAVRATTTTLRYYRSTDATISTADTEVGTDAVSGLAAAAAGIESISLTAPSTTGTYYYGACVDPMSGESHTGNNCTRAVRVTVSDSPMAIESFDLDSDNDYPQGITFANDRFYVVDGGEVFAYHASGQRDAASDFDLDAGNGHSSGITYANDRFYVVNWYDVEVNVYHASGQRDAASDFDLEPGDHFLNGITFANDRFYVVDSGEVFAYHASGQRDAASDFDLDPRNRSPGGIVFASDRFYVVDCAQREGLCTPNLRAARCRFRLRSGTGRSFPERNHVRQRPILCG